MRYLFVGRRTSEKTALLGALSGEYAFRSGATALQRHESTGDTYVDVPGFDSDASPAWKEAAPEIESCMKSEVGDFKLVFVVNMSEVGHVAPANGVLMKPVLDMLPSAGDIPYGIIVNNITRKMRDHLNANQDPWDRVRACLNYGHQPTAYVHLFNGAVAIESALRNSMNSLRRFLEVLPAINVETDGIRGANFAHITSLGEIADKAFREFKNDPEKVRQKIDSDWDVLRMQKSNIKESQDRLFQEGRKRKIGSAFSSKMDGRRSSKLKADGPTSLLPHLDIRGCDKSIAPSKHLWKLSSENVRPLPPCYPMSPSTIILPYLKGGDQRKLHLGISSLPAIGEISKRISAVCQELDIVGYWDDSCPSATLVTNDGVKMKLRMHLADVGGRAMIGDVWTEIKCVQLPSSNTGSHCHGALIIEVLREEGCSLSFWNTWRKLFGASASFGKYSGTVANPINADGQAMAANDAATNVTCDTHVKPQQVITRCVSWCQWHCPAIEMMCQVW